MKGRIAEIFESVQGEGIYLGTRQIFLRFAECNLHCNFCICENADVILADGKEKNIRDLRKGNKLVAFDEINKKLKETTIEEVFQGETRDIYELELEDGNKLKITAEHRVFTQRGWVKVRDLKNTDTVLMIEE